MEISIELDCYKCGSKILIESFDLTPINAVYAYCQDCGEGIQVYFNNILSIFRLGA